MKRIGIFGTSGMARESGDIAWELGHEPIYVARDQQEADNWTFPGDVITEHQIDSFVGMGFVIGIGENLTRERLALRYRTKLRFINLIHPSATFGFAQRAAIEARQGVIVCAGVRFTSNIEVGDFTIFNQNATIAHDVIVEDFVTVAPGASISGNVHLGARCWVGTGSAINQGTPSAKLRVGAGTVIGSGAVVVKDCEAKSVYVGVPAGRIK